MKTVLKVIGLAVAGLILLYGMGVAALYTILELEEYQCGKFD